MIMRDKKSWVWHSTTGFDVVAAAKALDHALDKSESQAVNRRIVTLESLET